MDSSNNLHIPLLLYYWVIFIMFCFIQFSNHYPIPGNYSSFLAVSIDLFYRIRRRLSRLPGWNLLRRSSLLFGFWLLGLFSSFYFSNICRLVSYQFWSETKHSELSWAAPLPSSTPKESPRTHNTWIQHYWPDS